MRPIVRGVLWGTVLVLTGCVQQARQASSVEPAAPVLVLVDPQSCGERADCTTKVSRTLLFVFDYAAAGGHLLQRQGRLLFTPDEVAPSEWPAIAIRLAEPADSRFEFAAECQVAQCRYGADELLRVYRSYLADRPCSLLLDAAVRGCAP
ncbi:hypothetical protein [Pseudomonas sp. Gutcm_11s]|uniref:hypothetical protein n=1 Tax=Pseudomonas sp. Gutcm_11s TaxID=3026088 RepID=UPI0023612240|nr:hypothetical protein [Pseudomonas sp. Gutcm_11s]MDD0845211.1 hypothetical protein [Pseudomonas sp. Gutcm_11s]